MLLVVYLKQSESDWRRVSCVSWFAWSARTFLFYFSFFSFFSIVSNMLCPRVPRNIRLAFLLCHTCWVGYAFLIFFSSYYSMSPSPLLPYATATDCSLFSCVFFSHRLRTFFACHSFNLFFSPRLNYTCLCQTIWSFCSRLVCSTWIITEEEGIKYDSFMVCILPPLHSSASVVVWIFFIFFFYVFLCFCLLTQVDALYSIRSITFRFVRSLDAKKFDSSGPLLKILKIEFEVRSADMMCRIFFVNAHSLNAVYLFWILNLGTITEHPTSFFSD